MSYTKGPWRWNGGLHNEYYDLVSEHPDHRIDQVIEVVQGAIYSEYSSDPAYIYVGNPDDARLIEGAPALADAVERVIDKAWHNRHDDGASRGTFLIEVEDFDKLVAAHRKATEKGLKG